MNISDILETLQLDSVTSLDISPTFSFFLFLLLAILLGRYTPNIVQLFVNRLAEENTRTAYQNLVQPVQGAFRVTGTFILISLSLIWLEDDNPKLYTLLDPFVDFAVIASLAWLISRVFRQFVRFYGIDLLRRLGREVDELLLVLETLFNVIVGLLAAVIFAQSQDFNLVGLIASLGIGGLAIAFAAQKILEQLLSTIVLYLDRPFIPGDYIRVTLSSGPNIYGRIESIGIRSTKLRTSAKSTLIVIPNSILANLDIENVTRGKKVMVMLYLDFSQDLQEEDAALVKQVVTRSTESLFGIDPGSTSISFVTADGSLDKNNQTPFTRARVTFFILGSNEDSIALRKRLLELASEKMAKQLTTYDIAFTMSEPTIYVESPVTI